MTPKSSATWLKFAAWGFLAFAFVWALAPYGAISEPARLLLDLLDWPLGDAGPSLSRSEMWLSSIGAGLVVAMSVILLGIVAPAVERSDKQTARVAIWAFMGWYLVDSAGSVASGVPSNAVFNTLFLAVILIPLVSVRYET